MCLLLFGIQSKFMQSDAQEQNQLQILSHCLPLEGFDNKIITPSFNGAQSPEHVCPICHDQFALGKIFVETTILGTLATKLPCSGNHIFHYVCLLPCLCNDSKFIGIIQKIAVQCAENK